MSLLQRIKFNETVSLLLIIYHISLYLIIILLFPKLIYDTLDYFHLFDLIKNTTLNYLKFTFVVFLSVYFNSLINKNLTKMNSIFFKAFKKDVKKYYRICSYILSRDNIRFVIFSFYFIMTVILSIYGFQEKSSEIIDFDKVLLQSFVTFITFDRALTLYRELKFNPKKIITKI